MSVVLLLYSILSICQAPLFTFFIILLLAMWHTINFYSVKLHMTLKSVLRTLHSFTVFLKNSIFILQATFWYIFGCATFNWGLSGMVGIMFIYYYIGPTQVNNPKSFFFFFLSSFFLILNTVFNIAIN